MGWVKIDFGRYMFLQSYVYCVLYVLIPLCFKWYSSIGIGHAFVLWFMVVYNSVHTPPRSSRRSIMDVCCFDGMVHATPSVTEEVSVSGDEHCLCLAKQCFQFRVVTLSTSGGYGYSFISVFQQCLEMLALTR